MEDEVIVGMFWNRDENAVAEAEKRYGDYCLRIAAKLVEETPEAVAIGDVDGDGKITVSDALRILRVAAKLSDTF